MEKDSRKIPGMIAAALLSIMTMGYRVYGEATAAGKDSKNPPGEATLENDTDAPDISPEQRAAALTAIRADVRRRVATLMDNGAEDGVTVKLSVFGRVVDVTVDDAGDDGIEGEFDGEFVEIGWDKVDDAALSRLLLSLGGGEQNAPPLDILHAGILLYKGGEQENGMRLIGRAFERAQDDEPILQKLQAVKLSVFGNSRKMNLAAAFSKAASEAPPKITSKIPPLAIPTFHCLGLYWSPEGGSADKQVLIQFREVGSTPWRAGLPMRYRPINSPECKADYRGSLVNLTPGANYQIILTLEGTDTRTVLTAATWSETFPIASTVRVNDRDTTLLVNKSGKPTGYVLYDGTNATIDTGNKSAVGIFVDADYVIIRGFTIKNVSQHGIRVGARHNVVIEDCDISHWGSPDKTGFGIGYQGGIYSNKSKTRAVVIQRNKIHNPNTDSNSWAEKHHTFHPDGPQGIVLWESEGNHVIRYNEIWSDKDHYYNDILGGGENGSYTGYPGADSDIYGNYLANCFDDGIEVEGGGQNVRIWNNYIENVYLPIGNAANSIGPLYIWRNVSGRCYSLPNSKFGDHNGFLKMGYADSESWMTGHFYVFNNTIYQPNDDGASGLGGSGKPIKHCMTRNNILHVRRSDPRSIATNDHHIDNDFDHDLMSSRYPTDQEKHGIRGTPKYVSAVGFSFETKIGNFQLAPTSRGYDEGVTIPNFCDWYLGKAPDMGAQESGAGPVQYGVTANFTPPGTVK